MLDALLEEARGDDNVVGVVLFGSRGRGAFVTEQSDWDVFVVVRENRDERPFVHGARLETVEVTVDELRSPPAWNRYALAWLEPQLDKTGEVAAAMLDAVRVDPATAGEPLDGYVNLYYRSAKNARAGLALASLLDAQESVGWFLEFVFAVHGRLRPYNKWLEWELEHHPLPWSDLPRLERIARTGDLAEQQALFRDAEALARSNGLGAVIDGWEPDVAWLRGEV
ncbi:MAG TPA: nucleotidyltransferase domain-containing protein [Gaiellaceae bacterium]|nr:nucleotidyltransferase domain-containing protein [Gaiellaceae bacterium]